MERYIKRIDRRESELISWFNSHDSTELLATTRQVLQSLPRDTIREGFREGLAQALNYAKSNPTVRGIEFSWYFAGRETGEALAYAYDSIKTKGTLAKSDPGPVTVPGVEIKAELGNLIDEYFAAIPTHKALNAWVEEIKPKTEAIANSDAQHLTLELCHLWNYRECINVAVDLLAPPNDAMAKLNSPLWILLAQQDRNPAPILVH